MIGRRKPGGPEFNTSIRSLETSPHGEGLEGLLSETGWHFLDTVLTSLKFELGHHGQELNVVERHSLLLEGLSDLQRVGSLAV